MLYFLGDLNKESRDPTSQPKKIYLTFFGYLIYFPKNSNGPKISKH
jgi:hypothetical protein